MGGRGHVGGAGQAGPPRAGLRPPDRRAPGAHGRGGGLALPGGRRGRRLDRALAGAARRSERCHRDRAVPAAPREHGRAGRPRPAPRRRGGPAARRRVRPDPRPARAGARPGPRPGPRAPRLLAGARRLAGRRGRHVRPGARDGAGAAARRGGVPVGGDGPGGERPAVGADVPAAAGAGRPGRDVGGGLDARDARRRRPRRIPGAGRASRRAGPARRRRSPPRSWTRSPRRSPTRRSWTARS